MMNKNTTYYIPYGYAIIGLSYGIDLDEAEKQEKAIQPVLSSFRFTKEVMDDPLLSPTIQFNEPPFEITTAGNFRIQKNNDKQSMTLLAEAVEKDRLRSLLPQLYKNDVFKVLSIYLSRRAPPKDLLLTFSIFLLYFYFKILEMMGQLLSR